MYWESIRPDIMTEYLNVGNISKVWANTTIDQTQKNADIYDTTYFKKNSKYHRIMSNNILHILINIINIRRSILFAIVIS